MVSVMVKVYVLSVDLDKKLELFLVHDVVVFGNTRNYTNLAGLS